MHTLHNLKCDMQLSLLKTLARTHHMTVSKVKKRYKAELVVNDKKYSVLQVSIPRQDKKPLGRYIVGMGHQGTPRGQSEELLSRTSRACTKATSELL
jgi:hypothetical protein